VAQAQVEGLMAQAQGGQGAGIILTPSA
jgi:hypothetical protein